MKQLKIVIFFIHLFSVVVYADEISFDEEFSERETISDPLIVYNRFMTSVNDKTYIYILEPTSKFYATIVPEFLRIGISNAFENIKFPIRFVNNILQLKFENSLIELERFVVNSTIGIGGLMDPAGKYMNLHAKKEDFGQTLGHYGIESGIHIVLPLIGPSNIRDGIGMIADAYISPLNYFGDKALKYKIPQNYPESNIIWGADKINYTSFHLGEYESNKKDAVDWYLFLRNAYESHRTHEIGK